jgi:cyclophilin family peptidyl-prolyl cis-trans isomerase
MFCCDDDDDGCSCNCGCCNCNCCDKSSDDEKEKRPGNGGRPSEDRKKSGKGVDIDLGGDSGDDDDSDSDSDSKMRLFFDVRVGNADDARSRTERIVIELRDESEPVKSFRALCIGEKGVSKSGQRFFVDARIQIVAPGVFAFVRGDATRGEPFDVGKLADSGFDDESKSKQQAWPTLLSMSSADKGANGGSPLYFITVSKAPHEKRTVIGVVKDLSKIVKQQEQDVIVTIVATGEV